MIVFAVCDDDAAFTNMLARHLETLFVAFPDEMDCRVQTFTSAEQVLRYLEKNPIHILFLDIDMPGKNGFELAETLQRKSPSTILVFVSAYESLVYDAFRYQPFYFLRKTHMLDELHAVVQKVAEKYLENNETKVFPTVDGDVNIRIQDIAYIESVRNYYHIHHASGTVYRCRGTLAALESELAEFDFYRVLPAFLINLANIRSVGANRQLLLTDGTTLTVSLRKWKGFNEAYMRFSRKRVLLA